MTDPDMSSTTADTENTAETPEKEGKLRKHFNRPVRFLHLCLPYCLERQEDGSFVALNRDYKPIGFNTRDFVNFEDFPITHAIRLHGGVAKTLSWNRSPDTRRIYLYNDATNPSRSAENMRAYMEKLERLSRYKVR